MASRPLVAPAARRKMSPMGRLLHTGAWPEDMGMVDPIINVLLFFDRMPPKSEWVAQFEKNLWPSVRFSSRMEAGYWVQEAEMDRAYHFTESICENEAAIDARVQGGLFDKLAPNKPPWKVLLFHAPAPSRSAAYFRLHHTIGDGLGLLFASVPLMRCEGGDPLAKVPLPRALLPPPAADSRQASAAAAAAPQSRLGLMAKICQFIRGIGVALLARPDSELSINPPLPTRTPYMKFNRNRVYTRFPPIEMSLVQQIRRRHGCTVNDVLMAALTGTLRRFGAEVHGDEQLKEGADGRLEFKSLLLIGLPRPVDPADMAGSISNRHLYASCPLPIGESTPAGRVGGVVRACSNLKSWPYMAGLRMFIDLVSAVAPTFVIRKAAAETFSKHSLLVTNVPATTVPFTLPGPGGCQVSEIQMVFPNIVPQVSIISYNGRVYANIVADPALFPRPADLSRMWVDEFQRLLDD